MWITVNENLIADAERELLVLHYPGKIYKNFSFAESDGVIVVTYKYLNSNLKELETKLSTWLRDGEEDFEGPVRR